MLLDYDVIADVFEEKKRDNLFMAKYYPQHQVTKSDIFEALNNRLKIRGCSLRELFGLVTMTGNDEISLYEATRILITELNTPGYDFSEAVHKYVINHMIPDSKTQVSFKSLLDEFEDTLHIDKGKSEIAYRENCIKKMLDKISLKLIQKEIDFQKIDQDDFSFKEMNDFLKVDLDIFNQEPMVKIDKLNAAIKKRLGMITKKDEEGDKDSSEDESEFKPHEITEKERGIFKDTMEYIMDQKDTITVQEFTDLMQEYLGKQKH